MAAGLIKPEYGPSLVRLLEPRWRAASRGARAAATAAAVAVVAALVGAGLTLENAMFSHGGPVPFSFEYRDLYRVQPEPGGYVRVQGRWPDGALKYSFAVAPLVLPPYHGELTAEMPLYATGFIRSLSHRYQGFALQGEGKAKVSNTLIGYQVGFFTEVEGREMYGRVLLLTPPQAHPRAGVAVSMLAAPTANAQVDSPVEVGDSGLLARPLKSFSFG